MAVNKLDVFTLPVLLFLVYTSVPSWDQLVGRALASQAGPS